MFYCEQTACESKSWYEKDAKLAYSHELQGLVSGKQYSVRVAGYTKIGRGMRSPTIKRVVTGGLLLTTTRETTSQKSTTSKYCFITQTQWSNKQLHERVSRCD